MVNGSGRRSAGLVVAVGGAVAGAVVLGVFAVASVAAGHGDFSGGVGIALIVYAVGILAAAIALWRGSVFGRGPVLATALLNVAAAWSFTATAPLAWIGVAVAATTAVAAALPASSAALHARSDPQHPGSDPASTGSEPGSAGRPPGPGAA